MQVKDNNFKRGPRIKLRAREPLPAGDNSQIWRQSQSRGTVSVFRRQVMLKKIATFQKIRCPSIGRMSPVLETKHVSDSGDILPIGRQYEKCHILGIFRLSCAFYYEKAHVKTSWEDTSPSRPKFNPLHQRNSPLRLVQR